MLTTFLCGLFQVGLKAAAVGVATVGAVGVATGMLINSLQGK
jgi:hypothetical protein